MTKADAIENWLYSKVGCGYVYGATGWVCSQKRREQQAAQYPEYEKTILSTCAKWDGKQCFDCAQLVSKASAEIGVKLPSGATSQWKSASVWAEKGEIVSIPEGKLACVFRQADGRMQHVGWRLRNGDVIDARGSADGVVLNKNYGKWTHWAILDGLGEEREEVVRLQAKVVADSGKTVNLRKTPTISGKLVEAVPVGDLVDIIDMTAGDWWEVLHDGKGGFMMAKFLSFELGTPDISPSLEERIAALEARVATLEQRG